MARDEQVKAPADVDAELAPTIKVERALRDDSRTIVDGASPVHRGVLPPDFTGPSYSELRRKAHEAGNSDSRLALPVGFVLNEYVIERVLGIGGFGISYLAQDTNLNTKVAIKEYLPNDLALRSDLEPIVTPRGHDYVEDYKTGLTRFLQECRTLATFRHAHIVRVNRFFEAHNTAYMVMDYEYGESLGAWVKKRQERGDAAPDEAMLIRMFSPLLDGLDVVHQGGFMHRDVKPANIYVRDTDGSLVLLDFGAAREAVAQGQRALTSIVTPGYAPFEQYHSHGRQGPWSDIYAMGGVLYWIVTGQKPVEAAARVTSDPQEPAAQCAKGRYSERFLQAIDWALNPDDIKRPQTVAQFKQALVGSSGGVAAGANADAAKGAGGVRNRGVAAGRRRTFITVAAGGTALALASAGVGVALMKWGRGSGAALRMAVVPSSSGATEDIQIKAALSPAIDILRKAAGRDVTLTVVRSVMPPEGSAPYDLILGNTFTIGAAARDLQYAVVGKFRDAVALFVTRNGVPMDRFEDMKGARLGLHTREGMTGPMAVRALESNRLPLATSFASIAEIKGQEDNLVQALIDEKVDVVALSPGGYAEAEKQFPNKVKLIATSDPLPGYGIALRHSLDAELALKLTQTLWKIDDSEAGRAALKAINLGSASGSLEIRQANSREYVRATELIEAGRKLFPAAKP